MKLFDLESPQTKQSQKVLESYFSKSIDFENIASSAAKSMLTKVRSLISEHRTHNSERDPGFVKLLVMERGLTARLAMREADVKLEPQTGAMKITADGETIGTANNPQAAAQFKMAVDKGDIDLGEGDYSAKKAAAGKDIGKPGKNFKKIAKGAAKKYGSKAAGERVAGSILNKLRNENVKLKMNGAYLTENEVQQAQVVLAAQDMVDRIQDMLEDVTAMQFKDLPALSASISSTVGTNESQAFNNAASGALASLVDAIQAAKVGMETAQGTLTGQEPVVPGAEEVATPADPMADDPIDAVDDVEVDVDIEEPASNSLGRARR
jgi:hypothetical protein